MFNYIVRRSLYAIPLVFGVALITFALFNLVGGDPTPKMLGKFATEEQILDLRKDLGLEGSRLDQFIFFLKQCATFDFGYSWATKQKISTMLLDGLVPSLTLTVPAFFMSIMISVSISLFCAYFRGSWFDRITVLLCVLGMCISMLAYIIAGQYYLAFKLDMFEISGYEKGFAGLRYFFLPWLIYVTVSLGAEVRFYRTVILDETGQDYVRTARAKGLSNPKVLFKHVLKNAMIPILTNVIITLPFLYTGSLLLENFFGIPGLGYLSVKAINESDFPVIKAVVFIGSVLYIFANLMTDICYSLVDPRVELS